jgi:hypothetical protein
MTTGVKILIGTTLVITVTGLIIFRKKVVATVKKAGKVFAGSSATTIADADVLKRGSADEQHVTQLQEVLNGITDAVQHINENCKTSWGRWPGGKLAENGIFDTRTEQASQFYLNRIEVDLDYLNDLRAKMKAYRSGDKCIYPLSIKV